jgi:hypothetical protein
MAHDGFVLLVNSFIEALLVRGLSIRVLFPAFFPSISKVLYSLDFHNRMSLTCGTGNTRQSLPELKIDSVKGRSCPAFD